MPGKYCENEMTGIGLNIEEIHTASTPETPAKSIDCIVNNIPPNEMTGILVSYRKAQQQGRTEESGQCTTQMLRSPPKATHI